MIILVLRGRRNELEFDLFEMPNEKEIIKGNIIGCGNETAIINYNIKNNITKKIIKADTYENAIAGIEKIVQEEKLLKNFSDIDALGHRVVHGGKNLLAPVKIDSNVLLEIKKCIDLAPLHNPYNLKCIEAAQKILPGKIHVAVFDTAFHSTIPEYVKRYAIPEELYRAKNIFKYGFHGISHEHIVEYTANLLNKKEEEINIISCHLGRGGSVNAIKNGKSFDISMGFTPLDGLIMSTRCGEIDAGAVLYLLKTGLSLSEVETILNTRSGLLGLSGISEKMDDLIKMINLPEIKLVIDMYVYRVRKFIGAYLLNLGHIDALTFTGGIGTNCPLIREKICENLENFGIELDINKNNSAVEIEADIGKGAIKILVIPRNESLLISRSVYRLINNK